MRRLVLCVLLAAGLCATVLLEAAIRLEASPVVRISDLQYSPTPPNPIKVFGWITAETPLTLSDGRGDLVLTGINGKTGDLMVIEGDYASGVLAVSQDAGKATVYAGSIKTEMAYVPSGSFLMGNNGSELYSVFNELPQHLVSLSGYWIGRYEVTRGEYRRFIVAGGYSNPGYWSSLGWQWRSDNSRTQPAYWSAVQNWGTGAFTQTDAHPVVGVTYWEADAYCRWAGGRLPTEAQWEKAARWAGYPRVYPWAGAWQAERCNNWNDSNPAGGGSLRSQTAPVGSYYPTGASPYGCQDMAGNVLEWVADWYGSAYYSQTPSGGWVDPSGPQSGSTRVFRGGSYANTDSGTRCAFRGYDIQTGSWNNVGFRVAR